MRLRSRIACTSLVAMLVMANGAWAEGFGRDKGDDDVEILLGILAGQGIGTTNKALIRVIGSDESLLVRSAAIAVLGHRRASKAVPALMRVLDDNTEDLFLRQDAAIALGLLGNKHGKETLGRFFESETETTRRLYLATRLAEIGNPIGYKIVEENLRSGPKVSRIQAVAALGEFVELESASAKPEGQALAQLLTLADDPDLDIRKEVLGEVARLRGEGFTLPGACEKVRSLIVVEQEESVLWLARRFVSHFCKDMEASSARVKEKTNLASNERRGRRIDTSVEFR